MVEDAVLIEHGRQAQCCMVHSPQKPGLLLQGADLMKHGRHGKPKVHYFRLSHNDTMLSWKSAKNKQRGVLLKTVKQVGLCCCKRPSCKLYRACSVLLNNQKRMCALALQSAYRNAAKYSKVYQLKLVQAL